MSKQSEQKKSIIGSDMDKEVIEGEIVDGKLSRGRVYTKSNSHSNINSKEESSQSESTQESGGFTSFIKSLKPYRRYLLISLVLFIGVLSLVLTRPNSDWQIQHINTLQSDLVALSKVQQALADRVKQQETMLSEKVSAQVAQGVETLRAQVGQPEVTQADLVTLKQALEAHIAQLEKRVSMVSPEAGDSLNVEQLALEMAQIKQQLIELSAVKAVQGVKKPLQKEAQNEQGNLSAPVETLKPLILEPAEALSSLAIQKWIVEINTQWLLRERAEQTTQQLLALEQAVGLSNISYQNALSRLIGQDLAYLSAFSNQQVHFTTLDTTALRSAIKQISVNTLSSAKPEEKQAEDALVASGERLDTESAFEKLKARFRDMFTIKKRELGHEQTQVERLLMHDVTLQRALLLVDRVDWAVHSRSNRMLSSSIAELQTFIALHFPQASSSVNTLLTPFKDAKFQQAAPLHIMSLEE